MANLRMAENARPFLVASLTLTTGRPSLLVVVPMAVAEDLRTWLDEASVAGLSSIAQ